MESTTNISQFEYCSLCRLNHLKKRSHIYSRRHQGVLKSILAKYLKKIITAKKEMDKPVVRGEKWEQGAMFWCYMCVEEYEKHATLNMVTVAYAGLLQHIASDEHKKKTKKFWGVNKPQSKMEKYILDKEKVDKFLAKSVVSVKEHEKKEEEDRKKLAQKMEKSGKLQEELKRRNILRQAERSSKKTRSVTMPGQGQRVLQTAEAYGAGLTRIHVQTDESAGNIHSGATPPWLQDDDGDNDEARDVGPGMEEWQAHLKREEKAKLPPGRVGANFNRKTANAEATWLPSFGKVWNKNRRTHSKQQFVREEGWAYQVDTSEVQAYNSKRMSNDAASVNSPANEQASTDDYAAGHGDHATGHGEHADTEPVASTSQRNHDTSSSLLMQRISETMQNSAYLSQNTNYGHSTNYYGQPSAYLNEHRSHGESYYNTVNDSYNIEVPRYGYLENFGTQEFLNPKSSRQKHENVRISYDYQGPVSDIHGQCTHNTNTNSVLEQLKQGRLTLSSSLLNKK